MNSRSNFRKTSAKIRKNIVLLENFYSISETASLLNKSEDTIYRWCKSGVLPAIPRRFGSRTTFEIPKVSIENYLQGDSFRKRTPKVKRSQHNFQDHYSLLPYFSKYCLKGMIGGREFSERTVNDYVFYLKKFLNEYEAVTPKNLKMYFVEDDSLLKHPEKKVKLYKAVVCFCKFLVQEGAMTPEALDELKALKPEGNRNPKRHTVDEEELSKILNACHNITETFLVYLLGCTGMRASEAAEIKLEDIDLENREIYIMGKGRIEREVAILPLLLAPLNEYLKFRAGAKPTDYLLVGDLGQQMSRHNIYKRLKQIGNRVGIKLHPHALRRAFVTINANKGRSLAILGKIVGHRRYRTTELYCLTSQKEAVEAMKSWD